MAMEWTKNPRVVKILKIVGVVLFALTAFVISIGYTLPEDRVKSLIESRAADAGLMLTIDDLDAGGFGSVSLSGLKLELAPAVSETADGTRVEQSRKLEFDRVKANINLFSILTGSPSVRVDIEDEGGHIGPIRIKVRPDVIEVDVEEIVDFPVPRGLPAGPFPLGGVLRSGKGNFVWNREGGLAESEGAFELTADKLVALKPVLNTKQAGAIALTDIAMGKLEASVIIDKRSNIAALKGAKGRGASGGDGRVIYFDKFKIDGRDIRAMVEGSSLIRLAAGRPLSKAQMTVELAFAIDEGFYSKTPKDSTDTPNKFLKTLLDLDPRWKSARSGDYIGLICTGSLDKPSCVPKKPSVRGGEFKAPSKDVEGEEGRPVRPKASRKRTPPVRTPSADQPQGETDGGDVEPVQPPVPPQDGPQNGEPAQGEVEIKVGSDLMGQAANRAGPRAFSPIDNSQQRVGGQVFLDKSDSIRGNADMRNQLNVRPQEPGEPTEE